MKHRIKNEKFGYVCLTCKEPKSFGSSFTLSGLLSHLGRPEVSIQNEEKLEKWLKEHEDIINKLQELGHKINGEIEIEL